jgi:peptidoglycan hydrolase CwlO-like protein
MVDMINFIPWGFTLISVLIAIYSIINNNAKDDKKETEKHSIDATTVIVKLENIQQAVNKTGDMVSEIQKEIKGLDHRVTVIETKMGDEK